MAAALLICSLLLAVAPVWGMTGQPRPLCLSCHPVHYEARGGCTGCHRGNPASGRKNIAHAGIRTGKYARFTLGDATAVQAGERLLEQYACRRCHVSSGRGNRLAANLDNAARMKTAEKLATSIRQPVVSMPTFGMDEDRVTTLVNALCAGAKGHENDAELPVKVHFSSAAKGKDVFTAKCGSCHKMLSRRLGALGAGSTAPDLSGLFTGYYPKSFRRNEVWTSGKLLRWLKNPRDIRPETEMVPVVLTDAELRELDSIFTVTAEPGIK